MSTCSHCSKTFTTERGLKTHMNHCSPKDHNHKDPKTNMSKTPEKNGKDFLIGIFALLLLINIGVLSFFTLTVNSRLNEAINITKPIEGTLTLVSPEDCQKCQDLEMVKTNILKQNVELTANLEFSEKSDEGQKLIKEYNIQILPALVFETKEKTKVSFKKTFKKMGRMSGEKTFVFEQKQAPYFNLETKITEGLVTVTFLTDKNCEECYDAETIQKPILAKFGLVLSEEKMIDVSEKEGKELIEKYGITKVPTIVLSKETNAYAQLVNIWPQVGTIEEDGNFVFRKMEIIGDSYRDLETGKVVEPSKSK